MSIQFISFWIIIQLFNPNPSKTLTPGSVATSPVEPTVTTDNLIVSNDGGTTWHGIDHGLPQKASIGAMLATQGIYLVGTSNGLYSTHTKLPATDWHRESLMQPYISGIFPGKQGPYAVSSWKGIFQLKDGQWHPIDRDLKDKSVYAVLETKQGLLYVGCESGIYASLDNGLHWNRVIDPGTVHTLAEINGTLYACGAQRLWRSADGITWNRTMTNDFFPFSIHKMATGIVALSTGQEFAGYRPPNSVMLSKDNGHTWQPMFRSLPKSLNTINDLKQIGNSFFAASTEGIFRSTDQGATWEQVVAVPADDKGHFFKLYVNGDQLIAMRANGC